MKKIIIMLLSICLILSFAVACNGDGKDGGSDTAPSSSTSTGGDISVIGGSSDVPSDTSSTDSSAAASSEPTTSEILDWWSGVSVEVEAGN